jgi:hypothetical protein
MKKLLVVLLSLGLIVAFCATASAAADVKFGGSYYLQGNYESNPLLAPDDIGYSRYSHAFFYQRFRLQPVFAIAEGLTFTARMDAMEKQWGQSDWRGAISTGLGAGPDDQSATRGRTGTTLPRRGIQESLEFERAYVTFMTGIGQFQVGYQNVDDWGTDFGDYSNSRPRIQWMMKFGPMIVGAYYEKIYENDTIAGLVAPQANATDADRDSYALAAIYNGGKGIEGGLLYKYYALNNNRPLGAKTFFSLISPYAKATIGKFFIEGELQYWFGKKAQYEAPAPATLQDVDLKGMGAFVRGRVDIGPAYVGGAFSYASGNDMSDDTKDTTNPGGAGTNWSPALLLLNDGYASQSTGTVSGGSTTISTTSKYNTIIYNAFGGINPTPKLNIEMALTYAMVDKKALSKTAGVVYEAGSDKLGTEVDIKATYKIYDNLTYMVGAGYLWAGDYFKFLGTVPGGPEKRIDNTYILTNMLTLSF